MQRRNGTRRGIRASLTAAIAGLVLAAALPAGAAQASSSCPSSSPQAAAAKPRPAKVSPLTFFVLGGTVEPVKGTDGRVHLAYELVFQNVSAQTAKIVGFTVVDAATEKSFGSLKVRGFNGKDIAGKVSLMSERGSVRDGSSYSAIVPPGQGGYMYINVDVKDRAEVPCAIAHRVTVRLTSVPGKPEMTVVGGEADIGDAKLVLSPPLKGSGWMNLDGCCADIGPHRYTILPINGTSRAPEAFAIDWVKLNDRGALFSGDLRKNENWAAFGAGIYASAPGRVVAMHDGMKDNVPGKVPPGLGLDEAGGNFVLTKVGPGQFIFYAHLIKDSVRVKVGDVVRRGQRLGLLGNSGNSDGPHLHFHVINRASPLDGVGLPFVFDRMRLTGRFTGTTKELDDHFLSKRPIPLKTVPPRLREREMPLTGDVFRFD